jgi:putative PIN family toxin of toxin-antitoxin system
VLDTNTVVSGLLWHRAPHQLLSSKHKLKIQFFSCQELLDELAGILNRPKFLPRLTVLGKDAGVMLSDYRSIVTPVTIQTIPQSTSRDPDDDIVLACAVASRADLIVSGDKDLLTLKQYQCIPILNSHEAMQLLASPTP